MRRNGVARLLIVVLLAPALLLAASPSAVSAAAEETTTLAKGPMVTGTFLDDSPIPSSDVSCSNTGYLRLNSIGIYSIRNNMRCTIGGFIRFDDGVYVRAWGANDGAKCSFESGYIPLVSGADTDSTLIPFNLHTDDAFDPDCSISRGSVKFVRNASECDDPDARDCSMTYAFEWELGPLPIAEIEAPIVDQSGACPYFSISGKPRFQWSVYDNYLGGSTKPPSAAYRLTWSNMQELLKPKGTHGSGDMVQATVYVTTPPGPAGPGNTEPEWDVTGITSGVYYMNWQSPTTVTYSNNGAAFREPYKTSSESPPMVTNSWYSGNKSALVVDQVIPQSDLAVKPVGIQLVFDPNGTARFPSGAATTPGGRYLAGLPQNVQYGDSATTQPASCFFWFGEKKAVTVADDTDEPAAPIVTAGSGVGGTEPGPGPVDEPTEIPNPPNEVAGDDGDCAGFSLTDPTSWAGAGTCIMTKALVELFQVMKKVVGVLGDVLSAIGGLVGSLLAGIADLFQTLFIPSPGSWGFGQLSDQFKSRPPGSVLTGIGSGMQGLAGSYQDGGCGVLADFGDGAEVECSMVKSVPGYGALYALVQVGMFGLTGLSIFRTLASKVGGDDGS